MAAELWLLRSKILNDSRNIFCCETNLGHFLPPVVKRKLFQQLLIYTGIRNTLYSVSLVRCRFYSFFHVILYNFQELREKFPPSTCWNNNNNNFEES